MLMFFLLCFAVGRWQQALGCRLLAAVYQKSPAGLMRAGLYKRWRRHTLPGYPSTICAGRLNDSVRNGKRWTLPL